MNYQVMIIFGTDKAMTSHVVSFPTKGMAEVVIDQATREYENVVVCIRLYPT
jgi:hypothetical protein